MTRAAASHIFAKSPPVILFIPPSHSPTFIQILSLLLMSSVFFVIYVNGTASIVINVYSIYCIYAIDLGHELF